MNVLQVLSVEDVLRIHEILVADFALAGDPISPAGPRSMALVESAVGRQATSLGDVLKYPEPLGNAATLAFGLCCDHAFHNGNKRTALVSMLVHLDMNGLCLLHVRKDDLYDLMIAIANHTIGLHGHPRSSEKARGRRSADEQVSAIRTWISDRVCKLHKGEHPVTYRNLRHILHGFGFELDTPRSNRVDVVRVETRSSGLLRKKEVQVRTRVTTIGYKDDGTEVSYKDLRQVRRDCKLTEADGVDTAAFYDGAEVVDAFVNRYRTVLRRLSRN
jgi:death on curing protein